MAPNYASLCRAQLTFEYLHTNSTTHEFLFGALAELVDNSRDAGATKMEIFTVPNDRYRGNFLLNFLDDGCGMDPVELSQVIQFGRSMKRSSGSNQIGQYGNGLKSGSMRIGKDMILLTKKTNTMSCLFLSRTFHEQESISEVIVPMPSWNINTKEPAVNDDAERERHEIEMKIILKHSPFHTKEELFAKFNEIKGPTGTLVIIYNLKLLDNGESELDFTTNPQDILMKDPHAGEDYGFDEYVPQEKTSFRAYVSVLYSEPRMRILLQDKKVRTKKLINCLYKPISYTYTSNRFKTRSEKEVEKAEYAAKLAEEKAKELSLQAKEAMPRDNLAAKNSRMENTSRQMKAEQARIDAEVKRRIAEEKKKSLKEPKQLTFTFGFNTDLRKCDGMFIYNCNRLIRMCEKIGPQVEGGVKCSGVVGIVDVPYLVLEPTHNKQDFADAKEYKHLLRSMAEHMLQYWKDSKIEEKGVTSFWEEFGYTGTWRDNASNDQKYALKRAMDVPLYVQCDICLKWRQLQFSRKFARENIPDDWVCAMNTDNNLKSCSKPEQRAAIPMGKLQKEIKSVEQRAEQNIKKLKDRLEKAEKIANRSRTSTSQAAVSNTVKEPMPRRPATNFNLPKREDSKLKDRRSSRDVQKALEDINLGSNKQKYANSQNNKRKPETPKVPTPVPTPKRVTTMSSPKSGRKQEHPKQRRDLQRIKRMPTESSEEEEEDVKPSVTKRKKISDENRSIKKQEASTRTAAVAAAAEKEEENEKSSNKAQFDSVYKIDCKVEARINDKWYSAKIIQLKQVSDLTRVKVKFDLHSQDKYDKWFDESSSDLRLKETEEQPADEALQTNDATYASGTTHTTDTTHNSDATHCNDTTYTNDTTHTNDATNVNDTTHTNNEAFSMTANAAAKMNGEITKKGNDDRKAEMELLDGVCNKFRRCLHYFRPPDFMINKTDILHNLTSYDLRDFPLAKFVEDYERNITRLVNTSENIEKRVKEEVDKKLDELKSESSRKEKMVVDLEQDLAASKDELKQLRLNVNVMIRNILQGGTEIDPQDSSAQVDKLLHAIVSEIQEC